MNCQECEECIELLDSLAERDDELQPMVRHIKECSHCKKKFLATKKLDQQIKVQLNTVSPSPALLVNIQAQIFAKSQQKYTCQKSSRPWFYLGAVTAGIAIIFLPLIYYQYYQINSRLKLIAERSVSRHVNLLQQPMAEKKPATATSEKVLPKLVQGTDATRKVESFPEVSEEVLQKLVQGLQFKAVKKCFFEHKKIRSFLYQKGKESLSVSTFPGDDKMLKHWDGKVKILGAGKYHIVLWKEANIIYAVVMESEPEKIKQHVLAQLNNPALR